jgi:hypothetical protein
VGVIQEPPDPRRPTPTPPQPGCSIPQRIICLSDLPVDFPKHPDIIIYESKRFRICAKYETSSKAYEFANAKLHKKKPDKNFKGVVVINITGVYDASRGENAGKLIAEE